MLRCIFDEKDEALIFHNFLHRHLIVYRDKMYSGVHNMNFQIKIK